MSNVMPNIKDDDFIQYKDKTVKENSNKLKRNTAKSNDYYVSVIDDKGKIQITEAELAKKFSIYNPASCNDLPRLIDSSNLNLTQNIEKSPKKGFLTKRCFARNKIFGCSDEILNSRSSRVNICESGEETISNNSEYEINDFENDNANRSSYYQDFDNHKNGFDKVSSKPEIIL